MHASPVWVRWIIFALTLFLAVEAAAAGEARIYKFTSARKLSVNGRDHLVILATPPSGGATVRLVVPNQERDRYSPAKQMADLANGMQPGGFLQAETKTENGAVTVVSLTGWTPRPGEETPHGYVYITSGGTDKPGEMKIDLSKFGDPVHVIVPAGQDGQGAPAPNPLIQAEMKQIHEGDVVWADVTPNGKSLTISGILPWSDPQRGKMVRVGPADVDGQRGFAVEIATDAKPVTALIPMTQQKGKWITDQKLLAAAHRPARGTEVLFRTFDAGDKTWLLAIEPPPKQPTAAAAQHPNASPPPAGIPVRSVGGAGHVPGIGGGIPGGF